MGPGRGSGLFSSEPCGRARPSCGRGECRVQAARLRVVDRAGDIIQPQESLRQTEVRRTASLKGGMTLPQIKALGFTYPA